LEGILLMDKPTGYTSHDLCQKLRKILKEKRIGHTGTLDPLATGLMVLCVGRATKLVKYLSEHDKRYDVTMTLGMETDTLDTTGTITKTEEVSFIEEEAFDRILSSFLGPSMQIPPAYSAIKLQGKKMYEYARQGLEMPDIPKREVTFYEIKRLEPILYQNDTAIVHFHCHVSKGTYIRSLIRDIGVLLDLPAVMSGLRRTSVGEFSVDSAQKIEDVTLETVTFVDALTHLGMPFLTVSDEIAIKVEHGVFLPLSLFQTTKETILQDRDNKPLAIYEYDETMNIMRMSVKL